MNFNIPHNILKAMNIIKQNGYESYLVGGCVRDFLMGKKPADFDITTSATPEQTISCFTGYKVIETGLKHGTVTVLIDKEPIEITTFRIDGEYKDNRHPEKVEFTSDLKDDLSRRDFTVNALAYNPDLGIVDLFSGQEDLNNKIIRCVGNADERFLEDGLRILRALRFSSVLGFEIEEETAKSIKKNKNLLLNISKERIYAELSKLILGINAYRILTEFREVIEVFLPSIKEVKDFEKCISALSKLELRKELRYAALFAEVKNPMAELMSLKSDRKTAVYANLISNGLNLKITDDEISVKKLLIDLEYEELYDILSLKEAFGEDVIKMRSLAEKAEKEGACVKIKHLAVDGSMLMEKSNISGKEIGEKLKELLIAVIENRVRNDREDLIKYFLS